MDLYLSIKKKKKSVIRKYLIGVREKENETMLSNTWEQDKS